MKKVLYGTTALVAAGFAAGQASADGIKLGISGFYRGSAGILIGGDQHAGTGATKSGKGTGVGDFQRTSGGFRQEIRINFKGETTLDNGITVGVLVGINPGSTNANTTATQLNRAYVNFSGKYGDVRFGAGSPLDALAQTCVYDPGNVTANFGVNSANQDFTNAGLGNLETVGVASFETAAATCATFTQKGTSIAYFSPAFGGFTFAVSYTPEGTTNFTSGSQGLGNGTDLKNNKAENILTAGADYNHDFGGGWTLLVGGGGQWAFTGHTSLGKSMHNNKPSMYSLGFQLGIPGGFTAGASGALYENYPNEGPTFEASNAGTSGADGWVAAAGVSYTIDAVSLGLEGIYGRYQTLQGCPGGGSAACDGHGPGHDYVLGISLNGAYALGPGINLEGQVAYTKYHPGAGNDNDDPALDGNPLNYDAVEIDAGVAINF
jgi:hypothetical protein